MSESADADLYRRTMALLEPGEIELHGAVVHTDITSDEESHLHQVTIEVGDAIATALGHEDTYVYSGTDDPEFGVNQHQGLTIEDDTFVWECQQLLRSGTYDIVFYWEATTDIDSVLQRIREAGVEVVGLTESGRVNTA